MLWAEPQLFRSWHYQIWHRRAVREGKVSCTTSKELWQTDLEPHQVRDNQLLTATQRKPWSSFLQHHWWWRYQLTNPCVHRKGHLGARGVFPHHFCYGTFIRARNFNKFNGGLKVTLLYWHDDYCLCWPEQIHTCINSPSCGHQDLIPLEHNPLGRFALMQHSGPDWFHNNVSKPLEIC